MTLCMQCTYVRAGFKVTALDSLDRNPDYRRKVPSHNRWVVISTCSNMTWNFTYHDVFWERLSIYDCQRWDTASSGTGTCHDCPHKTVLVSSPLWYTHLTGWSGVPVSSILKTWHGFSSMLCCFTVCSKAQNAYSWGHRNLVNTTLILEPSQYTPKTGT